MAKETALLSPGAFRVNENGEVVVNNNQLFEAFQNTNEITTGEQGLESVSVSVSVSVSF